METQNSTPSLDKEFEDMQARAGATIVPDVAPAEVQPVVEIKEVVVAPVVVPEPVVVERPVQQPVQRTERPERYIPVPKYQDEKREWNQEKQTLLATIAKVKGFEPGSDEETKAIDAFAEKAGISTEAAKDVLDLARQTMLPADAREGLSKILKAAEQEDTARTAELAQKEETEYFESEYNPFESSVLDTTYAGATPEQKQQARELMDTLSHIKTYARLDIEDIYGIPKIRKQFDDLFAGTVAAEKKPVVQGRKGPESSKAGGAEATVVKASDFKKDAATKKWDFSRLHGMSDGDQKSKLISDLDPEAYVEYVNDLAVHENLSLEVRRNGQIVHLK